MATVVAGLPKRAPRKRAPAKPAAKRAPRQRLTPVQKAWRQADLDALKISPEVAWYMEDRGFLPPTCPPKYKTPEPGEVDPQAVFDPDRVDRVLASFHVLRHTKGVMAGKALDPDNWQIAYILAPWSGWVHMDFDLGIYVRVITTLYVDLPRKNGKTTLAGGVGMYLTAADGEMGAQVVAAATTREQAGFAFNPIKQLAEGAPGLRRHVKAYAGKVVHPATASYFQPVANVGDAQHGADLHGAIIDELHLHKTKDLIEALTTGTGSRSQPLIFFITTADSGSPATPYDEQRRTIEQLARGALVDASTYGVIWGALSDDEADQLGVPHDDPFSEATQRKANPGFGISPTRRYLREAAAKAQRSPAQFASYQRLHLGLRTKQLTKYIRLDDWDANAGHIDLAELKGMEAYGGLDLSSTTDVTALCWVFPFAQLDRYAAIWRLWIPEDTLDDLARRTSDNAYDWVKKGWLSTTPGNVVDYDFIMAQVMDDMEEFDVVSLAYDRWNSSQLVTKLDEEGVPMEAMGQGYASLSGPTKQMQRLILKGAKQPGDPCLLHGGNPVIRWMVDNLAIATDPAGNVKPDKASSHEKIDGVAALVDALAFAVDAADGGDSMYENDEVEFG
jgi:phage terminase large subunit-like protein